MNQLAEELYEAFRREVAASGITWTRMRYTEYWADLPTRDRHFWQGMADRIGRVLVEAQA